MKNMVEIIKRMPWNVRIATAFVLLIIGLLLAGAIATFFPGSVFIIVLIWALWTVIDYLEKEGW